ncbi:MAG: non-homologous end-joining DNA ligase [Chloroflexi bacterium]|nr:non-homologous end-joining DNA ligase [Chloroflexota bacterium]
MPPSESQATRAESDASRNLDAYDAKRDFAQTPEPPPREPGAASGPLTFVVQQHRATRMHYDVRLEVGGVMPSWPVPRGPSTNTRERRLAIQTEDHPLDYASFEGVIPSGQYGAGEVIVWDNGTYSPDEGGRLSFGDREEAEARVRAGIEAGKLSITFRGRKLKGSWTFVKTQASEDSWLLIKHQDVAADPDRELTAEDASVISGLSIADLQDGRLPDPARTGTPPHLGDLPGVEPGAPPRDLRPMQAHLSEEPFDDPGWFFEPKLDGIRALVTIEDGAVTLRARSGRDITAQYPALVRALAEQPVASAVLDGEIVTLDERGVPSFELLQQRMGLQNAEEIAVADAERPVLFFAFDVLSLDGHDLRRVALEHRVEVLARVLLPTPLVQRVETFAADGIAAFEAAKRLGLEGVVAKRRDSVYEAGRRSQRWLKVKARQTGDFIVAGHHTGEGTRTGTFGALLLGVRGDDGALRYVGRVGTGFDDAMLRELRGRLDAIETEENPFAEDPPDVDRVTFVRPELVAEVAYANETREGILRAPSFLRLRPDKPPSEVRRFAPVAPPASARTSTAPTDADAIASVLAQLDGDAPEMTLAVGAHEVRVTNLDKVMWPAHPSSEGGESPAVTKRDLLRYLAQVSPWLLPHMRDRPVTLTRYPDGIDGNSFYQKHYDRPPAFVESAEVYVDSSRRDETALLCNNLASLLWLGQLADLELHVALARVSAEPDGHHLPMVFSGSKEQIERSALGYPDFVLFDLDPYIYKGDEASGEEPQLNRRAFEQTVEVARWLKELLDAASLSSFVKTSGATGLHIHVPVLRHFDYPAVRAVANTFGEFLQRAHPAEITLEWETQRRTGKIFVDVNQNARTRNMATAFSPRPKPGAPVSMTLRWDELDDVYPSDFTIHTALARLAEVGDPWADIMRHKHDLRALIEAQ